VVLGGTGLVGRQIRAHLARCGWDPLSVSRRPAGPRSAALDLTECPTSALRDLFRRERPSVVVNAAGAIWGTPKPEMYASTVGATERVVAALADLPDPVRLVHLGSVHEYRPSDGRLPLDEQAPVEPVSAYGRMKLRSSQLVSEAGAAGLLDGVVLRVSNVVGPGMPRASLLGSIVDRLTAADPGRPVELRLGQLRGRRDFVDARDVARAVVSVARMADPPRLVNLGRGTALSVRDVVHRLIAVSGRRATVRESDPPAGLSGTVDWQQVDIDRAYRLLGWRPEIDLDASLRAMWDSGRSAG